MIPRNPAAVRAAAQALGRRGEDLNDTGEGICAHGRAVTADWTGTASDAAAAAIDALGRCLHHGGDAAVAARGVYLLYADALEQAQRDYAAGEEQAALGRIAQRAAATNAMRADAPINDGAALGRLNTAHTQYVLAGEQATAGELAMAQAVELERLANEAAAAAIEALTEQVDLMTTTWVESTVTDHSMCPTASSSTRMCSRTRPQVPVHRPCRSDRSRHGARVPACWRIASITWQWFRGRAPRLPVVGVSGVITTCTAVDRQPRTADAALAACTDVAPPCAPWPRFAVIADLRVRSWLPGRSPAARGGTTVIPPALWPSSPTGWDALSWRTSTTRSGEGVLASYWPGHRTGSTPPRCASISGVCPGRGPPASSRAATTGITEHPQFLPCSTCVSTGVDSSWPRSHHVRVQPYPRDQAHRSTHRRCTNYIRARSA